MQETKLFGYYLSLNVNVSCWAIEWGYIFDQSCTKYTLFQRRPLVFKEWSYAMIRLGIRWSSMR